MENQKAEEMKRKLKKRGISEGKWQYYLKSPHSWDFTNISSSGLCTGVEVVLLSPVTCTPTWVHKESLERFKQLRAKLKEVVYTKQEMDKFKQSENPDDNQFMVKYKQVGIKADKLQNDLQSACNALDGRH